MIANITLKEGRESSFQALGGTRALVLQRLCNQLVQHYADPDYNFHLPDIIQLSICPTDDWENDSDFVPVEGWELIKFVTDCELELHAEATAFHQPNDFKEHGTWSV